MSLVSTTGVAAALRAASVAPSAARLRTIAAMLFASGWALFWAAALSLVPLLPLWAPLALIGSGLALLASADRAGR